MQVRVWAYDFESGRLPQVCVRTGVPCTTMRRLKVATTPPWVWLFALVGVLPMLIIHWATVKRSTGQIAVAPEQQRRRRNVRLGTGGTVLLAFVLFGVAIAEGANDSFPSGLLVLIAIVLLLIALLVGAIVVPRLGVRARVVDLPMGARVVDFLDAHPAFAAAVAAMYGQAVVPAHAPPPAQPPPTPRLPPGGLYQV